MATELTPDEDALLWAAYDGDIETVQKLVDAGVNKDVKDGKKQKQTPLHAAAENLKYEIVRLLLAARADIDIKDDEEQTPLHRAAETEAGNPDEVEEKRKIVVALLDAGANKEAKDKYGRTPIFYAKYYPLIVKLLLDAGANIEATDNDGLTPLLMAAREGNIEVVKMLLVYGADTKKLTNDGKTAYALAKEKRRFDVVEILSPYFRNEAEANASAEAVRAKDRMAFWTSGTGEAGNNTDDEPVASSSRGRGKTDGAGASSGRSETGGAGASSGRSETGGAGASSGRSETGGTGSSSGSVRTQSSTTTENALRILGIAPSNATNEKIKSAYRRLALRHHPDKGGNAETFKIIQGAYNLLTSKGGGSRKLSRSKKNKSRKLRRNKVKK